MRVWTIQQYGAWETFQATGVLRANPAFIDSDFVPAYRWLVQQMAQRVGPPPHGVTFPVWVWVQCEDRQRARPDLRQAGHLLRGQQGVRLECDMPEHGVLLSDFDHWHYVLNNWYLPRNDADEQQFTERCPSTGPVSPVCQAAKQASWERIFDIEWPGPDGDYPVYREAKSIQGVVWEIQREQVRAVQSFIAR